MKKLPFNINNKRYYSSRLMRLCKYALGVLLLPFFLAEINPIAAQHCGGAPTTLAKWDFNSTDIECNGAQHVAPTPITDPSITPGAMYCPNQNNGCGVTTLGSVGHQNTPQYQNAICLANFYAVETILARGTGAPYDPDAVAFDPEGKANISVWYDIPKNTEGCLTSFALTVLQKQFDGSTVNFETQGIAVKRNGVLVYTETVPILPVNINGTPFNFNFTGDAFCSDGSERVEFEIIFGLAHRLTGPALPGTPGQTGYDDVCLNGYCKTIAFGGIIPATCGTGGANDDAQVLIQNFVPGDRYDYNEGDSYMGSATYASGSTPVPADGLIPNFPNPSSSTNYTFRVFQENCFSDFTVTLDPRYCCVVPTGSQLVVTPVTCDGSTANDDAEILVTGVSGGTRADISMGNSYTGSGFASASPLVGGEFTFTGLANPLVAQIYTVRVFLDADCFVDLQTTLFNESCIVPCTPPNGVTLASTLATCMADGTRNADATIVVSGVNGGDRVGMSPSIVYSGPDYDNAFDLVDGAYTFTGISTPDGDQIYTVRVYNTSDGCYIEQTVEIEDPQCGDCVNIGVYVISPGPDMLDADGSNNQGDFESCDDGNLIDLELTKTVDAPTGSTCLTGGSEFTWTITIANTGTMIATGVNVVDLIPDGLSMTTSNTAKGAFYGGSGWDVGDLNVGETAVLTITTIALQEGTYTNCAYINAAFPENDPDSSTDNDETANEDDDACAMITVTGDNTPIIEKGFSPMLTIPGVPTRLTIKITNNNDDPITLTSDFVDVFPSSPGQMEIAATPNLYVFSGITPGGSGIIANAGGTSLTIPSGTVLEPGLNQISVDVTVPVLGNYCNEIDAGDLVTDVGPNCLGAEGCIIANPDFQMAPIVATIMDDEIIDPGETTDYTITIENVNDDPMTLNQDFINELPPGLVVDGPVTSDDGMATLENGDTEVQVPAGTVVPPNTTYTIVVPLRADDPGTYTSTINMNEVLTTVGADNNLGNEEVSEGVLLVRNMSIFDLALIKTVNTTVTPSPYAPGDDVQFTITVTNQGLVDAFDVDVTDYFNAAELSTPTLVAQAGVTDNGGGSFTIDQLAAGANVSFDVTTTIDAGFTGTSIINNAEITGGSDTDNGADAADTDSTPNNNSSTPAETDNDNVITDIDDGSAQDDDAFEDDYDPAEILVGCEERVEAGVDVSICSTASVDLSSLGASITPGDLGGTWTTLGSGTFDDTNGATGVFGTAMTYTPSEADISAGEVILRLTTNDPAGAACDPVSDEVRITILNVNCGGFPWDGN